MPPHEPVTDDPTTTAEKWRHRLYVIIFEAETPAGKAFDVALLIAIVASVFAVCLESVESIREQFGEALLLAEWGFTIIFTIEYLVRLLTIRRPLRYALSFFGIVDLLAILPTYLSIFVLGSQSLLVVRALRLIRIFRVFKLARFLDEAEGLLVALHRTRAKITVFLVIISAIVLIMGSVMYLIEGADSGFTSIPRGIYWAIVTMTTVGYGDISPQTVPGQVIASFCMILGYAIIIVPTGVFSYELITASRDPDRHDHRACPSCGRQGHAPDALHCKFCGDPLEQ